MRNAGLRFVDSDGSLRMKIFGAKNLYLGNNSLLLLCNLLPRLCLFVVVVVLLVVVVFASSCDCSTFHDDDRVLSVEMAVFDSTNFSSFSFHLCFHDFVVVGCNLWWVLFGKACFAIVLTFSFSAVCRSVACKTPQLGQFSWKRTAPLDQPKKYRNDQRRDGCTAFLCWIPNSPHAIAHKNTDFNFIELRSNKQ